jgi:hypothetical protein
VDIGEATVVINKNGCNLIALLEEVALVLANKTRHR